MPLETTCPDDNTPKPCDAVAFQRIKRSGEKILDWKVRIRPVVRWSTRDNPIRLKPVIKYNEYPFRQAGLSIGRHE